MVCLQVIRGHLLLAALLMLITDCARADGILDLFKGKDVRAAREEDYLVRGKFDEAEAKKLAKELAEGSAGAPSTNTKNSRQKIHRLAKAVMDQIENQPEDDLSDKGPSSKSNQQEKSGGGLFGLGKKNGGNDKGEEQQQQPVGRLKQRQAIRPRLGTLRTTEDRSTPIIEAPPAKRKHHFSKKFKSAFKEAYQATKVATKEAYDVTKGAYQETKGVFKKLPEQFKGAVDSMSSLLQLDSKGRVLALIEEVDEDIYFVKNQFSTFSIDWAPIMESALNYLGIEDLDSVNVKSKDELDYRGDALNLIAFGYELMKLMIAWREHMLTAHQAYKVYLETVKQDLVEGQSGQRITVDKYLIFQLQTIHDYLILTSWMDFEADTLETGLKLKYLNTAEDRKITNYESDYFRGIVQLQEFYEPAIEVFKEDKEDILIAVTKNMCAGPDDPRLQVGEVLTGPDVDISTVTCVSDDDMQDVEEFFNNFRDNKESLEIAGLDLPKELIDFMNKLKPAMQYNTKVYKSKLLKQLKKAREEAEREIASD